MTKQYGVEPTFKFGTKPGDVSLVTGKPYNFAGQSKQKDGTVAFTSWDEWTDNLSDSSDTGWSGGFTTEQEIQDAIAANDKRADRGVAGYTHSRNGGWDRSKVDADNDIIAERKGGYIDRTMFNNKKGPNYGNFVKGKPTVSSIVDDTKSKTKVTPTVDIKARQPSDVYTPSPKAPPAAVNLSATGADYTSGDKSDTSPKDSGLSASSTFDTSSDDGSSENTSDTSYGGEGVGGWTAQGGFINKRTMTMSKTPPNKKKRGGLASRR